MNALKTSMLGGLVTIAGHAQGMEAVSAPHNPGYVVDEIVVTARAPSTTPGQEALAQVAAALEAQIREIVAAAQRPRSFVTKISYNGRIYFAPWRI
jgi:hypothetical protein